jgi:competence protein ComK
MERFLLIARKGDHQSECVLYGGRTAVFMVPPATLLEQLCLQNGSSLEGRITAFRTLAQVCQKPAVLISERSQILYFPTLGMENKDCVWICYNEILKIRSVGADHTEILFADGSRHQVDVNYRIIRNQRLRCADFLQKLNSCGKASLETDARNGIMKQA